MRPKAPPIVGIAWESDFEAGMRRSVQEGRPVYVCVNALLDEGERGNRELFEGYYRAPETGITTRAWVCFVGNGNRHDDTVLPDGSKVCSRYGSGTCACHQAALAFALRRFSADGETLVSPSHFVVDPDGATVYRADYMQGRLSFAALDAYLAQLSPRLAIRGVWAAREAKLKELGATSTAGVAAWGRAWIESGDAFASAGLVAALDVATDATLRAALLDALRATPAAFAPVLQDALEAATSEPDVDAELAIGWVRTALAVDPDLGAWGAARVVARAKAPALVAKAAASWTGAGDKPDAAAAAPRARWAEAQALRADKSAAATLAKEGKGVLPAARIRRALARAGAPEASTEGTADRDARREALLAAGPAPSKEVRDGWTKALHDPIDEIRVAAALALRRAGDAVGADVLLGFFPDPVEGPEIHAALVALAGDDRGDDVAAWESFVRASEGGTK